MDSALKSIGKSFTRYFMPGLVFFCFSIVIPAYIFFPEETKSFFSLVQSSGFITLSLIIGYLLDSAGSYKWTLHLTEYNSIKYLLSKELSKELNSIDQLSSDPDLFLNSIWKDDKDVYDRIMSERAEWVLVLETAFALLFSAVVILILYASFISTHKDQYILLLIPFIEIFMSFLISKKGVQRMSSHNKKLAYAVSSHNKTIHPTLVLPQ